MAQGDSDVWVALSGPWGFVCALGLGWLGGFWSWAATLRIRLEPAVARTLFSAPRVRLGAMLRVRGGRVAAYSILSSRRNGS